MTTTYIPISQLPIRKLDIDLSQGFERHWFGGDAFRSAYFNALSMSFPAGEQLFIDSVKNALPLLSDSPENDGLRALCKDFSAQEASHRHVHAQYNAELERQGFKNHLEARIWARFKKHEAVLTPRHHLAITVAYEHYTAVLSNVVLARPEMLQTASPLMQKLWWWHALEETEHKAVAFDLYQAVGGNHRWRLRWFIFVTFQFYLDVIRQTVSNLWQDGSLFKPSTWFSAVQFFFGRPSKCGGWTWLVARPLLDYFKRDFHPWQHDNQSLAQDYSAKHASDWRLVR
jgi:uncharacterized protein